MKRLRGRFWYSSTRLSIWACSFIAASARSAMSRPFACALGSPDGLAAVAWGGTLAFASCALASSCRCCSSSCCWRFRVSTRSRPVARASVTGSGAFARRGSSTFPPPSRFACASASARTGFSTVLALTRTTSSGCCEDFQRSVSGNLKCNVRITACRNSDAPTQMLSRRDCRSIASQNWIGLRTCIAKLPCNIPSRSCSGAILGTLGLCLWEFLRNPPNRSGACRDPAPLRLALDEVDFAGGNPDRRVGRQGRQAEYADGKRQPVQAHEVLAQHDPADLV